MRAAPHQGYFFRIHFLLIHFGLGKLHRHEIRAAARNGLYAVGDVGDRRPVNVDDNYLSGLISLSLSREGGSREI
jgi:hypothetical protein